MSVVSLEEGLWIETPGAGIFFGNKDSTFENLRRRFPDFRWARVRQTHGDTSVHAEEGDLPAHEADAHFSKEHGLALLISTADCAPVMMMNPCTGYVASIHAGWRGVASRIVQKTASKITDSTDGAARLLAWIGPHIQKNSFEVDGPVKEALIASRGLPSAEEDFFSGRDDDKFLVDLNALLKSQLLELGIVAERVSTLHVDTKTDLQYHSHRRDRQNAGRNLSFIVRL